LPKPFLSLLRLIPLLFFHFVWAQEPGPIPNIQFKWWIDSKIVTQIGISPEQVQAIEALWAESRKPLSELQTEIDKQHRELHSLFQEDSLNEQTYGKKIDNLYRLRAELEKKIMHFRLSVRNTLNPEQRKKLLNVLASYRPPRPGPPDQDRHRSKEPKPPQEKP
jgi:Spy/CpxP family protein refolding chaperone